MAEPSILPPQQHLQPSRKGKKAWRKNVDITQVQHGLEELREELIKGGPIAEKASAALFTTDTAGSAAIRAKHHVGRPLKADEILARRSAVPAVDTRKRKAPEDAAWARKVAEVAGRVTDGVVVKRRKRDGVGRTEYERLRRVAYGGDAQHKDIVRVSEEGATYDPWALAAERDGVAAAGNGWLEEKKAVREPPTLKRKPVSLAKNGKAVPAVAKPHAGKSYNPAFTDWDALIQREGGKEVEAERLRLEEARREQEIQELRERARREEELEQAGYSSNWESEWESEWEGIVSEAEEQESLAMKRPERKTKAERNKITRRKEEASRKLHEEKMKKREQQLAQVKILAAEAAEKEMQARMQLSRTTEDSSDDEAELQLRRRRLGAHRVPEGPLEVVLADELQESLRLLKPEGDLLGDRFRSIMVRGKVESRKKILEHKKKNVKATEKWSYKDWKLK